MARLSLLLTALPLLALARSGPSPVRIVGNLYYVGDTDLAAYLIVTPKGDILINSGFEYSVNEIRDRMKSLGFRFTDIKILINSGFEYSVNEIRDRTKSLRISLHRYQDSARHSRP